MSFSTNHFLFISAITAFSSFAAETSAQRSLINAPIIFEQNRGQASRSALFTANAEGARVFLTKQGATFVIGAGEQRSAVRLSFPGSNAAESVVGEHQTGGTSSFLRGSDPNGWLSGARHFQSVRARNAETGIDLLYYGNGREFEYDVILHPNSKSRDLRFRLDGAQRLSVDREGSLVIETPNGRMVQHRPAVWQQNGTLKTKILASYRVEKRDTVSLQLGAYDHTRDLVVDPVLTFATYLGGKSEDAATAVALDSSGNIYVTGFTTSVDFPTSVGAYRVALNATNYDAFVTKLNPAGTAVLYSTYIGGSYMDMANAIQVDAGGNAYIGGTTESTDFPTTAGSYQTASNNAHMFLSKLNPAGTALVYSTYLGTYSGYGDSVNGLAVDSVGSLYAVGATSGSIPTTPGAYATIPNRGNGSSPSDAFITKFSPAGDKLVYSTYFGGASADIALAVKLDSSNQAYITGTTLSTDLPVSATAYQKTFPTMNYYYNPIGFVACINALGSGLTYSTYLGGSVGSTPNAIFLDAQQNAYVGGQTSSSDFPITAGAFSSTFSGNTEAFLSKLNYTGSALIYSTFLGGTSDDAIHTVSVDANGSAIVTGVTNSGNFPYTPGSFPSVQRTNYSSPTNVAFLSKFNPAATSILYSTQFGSGASTVDKGLALDPSGNAIVVGYTISKTLPTTSGAFQTSSPDTLPGPTYGNGFVEKIDLSSTTMCSLSLSASSIAAPLGGVSGTISVTVNAGCPWEASSLSSDGYSASFVTLGTPAYGVGSGTFTYTIPGNYQSFSTRSATIKVGSSSISVFQAAGSCSTPGITPSIQNLDLNGGLNSVSVQLPSGCTFTPVTTAPWIQLSSTLSVSGSASVYYFVTRNDYATRGAYINIAGTLFPVVQYGSSCSATLSSTSASIASQGGTGLIPFTVSPSSCQWTGLSYVPWIQVTAALGSGSGYEGFTVSPNPGSGARSGQILLAGQFFTVTQGGGASALPASYNVTTSVGTGVNSYSNGISSGDGGNALGASLVNPTSVGYDASGSLFIGDAYRIRKVDSTGTISTIAGNGTSTDSGDGGSAVNAMIAGANYLTFDPSGNLFFATGSYRIRSISPSGTINTVAGTGVSGNPGDNSSALVPIPNVTGLASDASGALYIPDGNSRIRKLSAGVLSYYAGTGTSGYNGDGLAPSATQLSNPFSTAFDSSGNLFFIDGSRIRKISGGKVTTIGGGGSGDGEGVAATSIAISPNRLAVDAQGSVFYSETTRVRRITTDGKVTTVAGSTNYGYGVTGDGGPALTATFYGLTGLAVDKGGNIAVIDPNNARVRLLTPVYSTCTYSLSGNNISVSGVGGTASITVTTAAGCAYNGVSNVTWATVTASGTGPGTVTINYNSNGPTARSGIIYLAGQLVTISQAAGTAITYGPTNVGVMQIANKAWALDSNGNGGFDSGDRYFTFLADPGDIAVVGDWNGDGHMKAGVYRNGFFCLDLNNNGVWDGPSGGDLFIALGGQVGDIPVVGDWNGNGKTKVGVYRHGFFILDTNGNGVFDSTDQVIGIGGYPGEQPVVGDWNGSGTTKVGVLDGTGRWILDYNGNGVFDSGDKIYSFPYGAGYKPVVGDWNGDKKAKIGVYTNGFWILDYNGNGTWEGPSGGDRFYGIGGNAGETPVVGDWNGTGTTKVGVYTKGFWILDYNGNGTFDNGDRFIALGGTTGEQPVVGPW